MTDGQPTWLCPEGWAGARSNEGHGGGAPRSEVELCGENAVNGHEQRGNRSAHYGGHRLSRRHVLRLCFDVSPDRPCRTDGRHSGRIVRTHSSSGSATEGGALLRYLVSVKI